ncbi:MAG: putative glycosyl transferase [Mycobacterium sp.]|jgi:ADP-heptose:LPS heptosyltransferase|nr:putative glycosyl transferase [Mycobacterium sp.]
MRVPLFLQPDTRNSSRLHPEFVDLEGCSRFATARFPAGCGRVPTGMTTEPMLAACARDRSPAMAVGPVEQRWPDVNRIAVLRGGGLGDVLSAVPAMDALAAAYPKAEIVLLTPPGYRDLMIDRPSPVNHVVPLPPARGVYEPDERFGDATSGDTFYDEMRSRPVDLGVQVHGGGRWSNPFLLSLRPRWTVGTRTPDAEPLTRWVPYRFYQQEAMRWLEVVGLAGATPVTLEPRIAATDTDLARAQRALPWSEATFVVIHPGARDPRRRWPAENFASIVATCVDEGLRAVVVGTPAEQSVMEDVAQRARAAVSAPAAEAVVVLAGLDLSSLCGVLARADLLIGNDSGVRHLARAVGTPTVGIFWIGNAFTAGPLGRSRDRVLMSWTTRCPVCDRDCTRLDVPRCEHDVSFVADVTPAEVMDEVSDLLHRLMP